MTFNFYDRVLASSLEARFRGPNPLHYGMELGAGDGWSKQKLGFFGYLEPDYKSDRRKIDYVFTLSI